MAFWDTGRCTAVQYMQLAMVCLLLPSPFAPPRPVARLSADNVLHGNAGAACVEGKAVNLFQTKHGRGVCRARQSRVLQGQQQDAVRRCQGGVGPASLRRLSSVQANCLCYLPHVTPSPTTCLLTLYGRAPAI